MTYEADKGSMWTLLLTNLGRCLGSWGGARREGQRGRQLVGSVCVQMDTCWSRMLNTSTGWCEYLGWGKGSEACEEALVSWKELHHGFTVQLWIINLPPQGVALHLCFLML